MLRTHSLRSSLAPACVLAGLSVVFAAAASRAEPVRPVFVAIGCGATSGQGGGPDTLTLQPGSGLYQPVSPGRNLVSVRPSVVPTYPEYSSATLTLVEWDPVALAPDPTAVAVRSRYYDISNLQYGWLDFEFVPPVVSRAVDHVADPPRSTLAWRWRNTYAFGGPGTQRVPFAAAGPAGEPAAFHDTAPPTPLAGAHPVLDHQLCLGDSSLQALRLVQAVGHVNASRDTSDDAIVQRFRVPVLTRLNWVEFVLDRSPLSWPYTPGTLAVYDAQGQSAPALSSPPLVQADIALWDALPTDTWSSHVGFDAAVTLMPGHDYWLLLRTEHQVRVRLHHLTGTEGPDFDTGIGEFWARTAADGPWVQQPSTALAFRLVGEPMGAVVAPPPHATPLALRVSPNPVRGETVVQWSGTTGAVSLDVLDVRGRRVGGGRLDAAGPASWRWRAVDATGAPLPAGVYFVRATDGAGRAGSQRVVVAR